MADRIPCSYNGVRRQSPKNNNEYQCENNGREADTGAIAQA
jgi:hypothetical protein